MRFFQLPYCRFFETSVLKEVRILRYLHNNSVVLILMLMLSSKIKLSYNYNFTDLKNFRSWLFYDKVFTLYIWKTQNISESMFLHNAIKLS